MIDLQPLCFVVPGMPVAKGRHRTATRVIDGEVLTRHYTPKTTVDYQRCTALFARQAMRGRALINAPVLLALSIVVPPAKTWPKAKRAKAMTGRLLPTKKPDLSNVLKAIEDALNGVVWHDDVQVVGVIACKRFGAEPGVVVSVTPLAEEGV